MIKENNVGGTNKFYLTVNKVMVSFLRTAKEGKRQEALEIKNKEKTHRKYLIGWVIQPNFFGVKKELGVSIGPRVGLAFGSRWADWMYCVSAQAKHLQEYTSYLSFPQMAPQAEAAPSWPRFYFNGRKIIFLPQLF